MIIIGLGTGRCGTLSLSKLLSLQGCVVTHEVKPLPRWDLSNLDKIMDRIRQYEINDNEYCGDVCSGYLNYVEPIYEALGNRVRFICLERDKKHNIESWVKKAKNKNYWSKKGSKDEWSPMFPKYDHEDKRECLSMYWEEYNHKTNHLQEKISVFKKIRTEQLNDDSSIVDILKFCEIKPKEIKKVHVNASK